MTEKSHFNQEYQFHQTDLVDDRKQLKKILRYVNPSIKGETQHFFLTGKRRMSKTSVTDFVKDYVDFKKGMIGVYVSNKGNYSIETLTKEIIEALINELHSEKNRIKKIKKCFGKHIQSIEIKGTKVNFDVDENLSRNFKNYFQDHILEIYNEFPESKQNGILIIIDDINGLSKSREFADWYKKLADTLAVSNHYSLPVYFFYLRDILKDSMHWLLMKNPSEVYFTLILLTV